MKQRRLLTLLLTRPMLLSKIGLSTGVLVFKAEFAVDDMNSFVAYLESGGSENSELSTTGLQRRSKVSSAKDHGIEVLTEQMRETIELLNRNLVKLRVRLVLNVDQVGTR